MWDCYFDETYSSEQWWTVVDFGLGGRGNAAMGPSDDVIIFSQPRLKLFDQA